MPAIALGKLRWRSILGWFGYTLFAIAFLMGGTVIGWASRLKHNIPLPIAIPFMPKPPPPMGGVPSVTLLILGCDSDYSRGGKKVLKEFARSDTILVAKVDFQNNRISGVFIPRDTLATAPKIGQNKINAFNELGGPEAAKAAVEDILPGVHVDRVIRISVVSFQKLVDMAGGVDMFIPKKMHYIDKAGHLDIELEPGNQHLNGYQAMGFVRFRHTDDTQHRSERQGDFLLALKKSIKDHWTHLPEIANQAYEMLGSDLSEKDIYDLAAFGIKIGADNIKFGLVDVIETNDKAYDERVDQAKLPAILSQYHLATDSDIANPPAKSTSEG